MWGALRRASSRIVVAAASSRSFRNVDASFRGIPCDWRAPEMMQRYSFPMLAPSRFYSPRPSMRKRTRRHKTPRSPRKKRAKPMVGTSRRLMPAQSIYKNKPKLPKGHRKLSVQEVEHEKFKVLLTRTQMRQCAWTNEDESRSKLVHNAPQLRRAVTSWNDFESVQTVKKIEKPPIKTKKRPKKVKVSTVVSFDGKEAGKITSGGRKQRRLLARTAAASAATTATNSSIAPRKRKPSQLPPSDKRIDPEKRRAAAAKKKKSSSAAGVDAAKS